MTIEAISGAATVAMTCSIVFVLGAKSWHALARTLGTHPMFPDSIMHESAERFRDELDRLSRSQATYLGAGLVFAVVFGAAYVLQAQQLFAGYPRWQLYILLGALLAALLYALYRLARTIVAWRQIRFRRDASIAVGHQLQRIVGGHGHVYHDVPTTTGVVDHVIVGQDGAYAVHVVADRAARKSSVRLEGDELVFAPSGKTVSIVEFVARTSRLEREFHTLIGAAVRVRSVLAVPGSEVGDQSDDTHLVVNERTLSMLRGWKDAADYLLHEDIETLQAQLAARCKRSSAHP